MLIILFFIYCCIRVSSECTRREEAFYNKGKDESVNSKKNL